MSITLHELAYRMRERKLETGPGAKMEITFGVAGLVESATLIQFDCTEGFGCSLDRCPTRTKIV